MHQRPEDHGPLGRRDRRTHDRAGPVAARTAPGQTCVPATEAGDRCRREAPAAPRRPAPGHPRAPPSRAPHTTCSPAGSAWTAPPSPRAVGEVRPLLAERGCTVSPAGVRLRTPAEVVDHLGSRGRTGIVDATVIRLRRPAAGHKNRDRFISGASRTPSRPRVLTDGDGRVLFCSPTKPGSCTDITHARQLGPVKLLAHGPAVEISRRCRLPGPGRADQRSGADTAAPQVPEEHLRLGTRRRASGSGRHNPHDASASSTASPT